MYVCVRTRRGGGVEFLLKYLTDWSVMYNIISGRCGLIWHVQHLFVCLFVVNILMYTDRDSVSVFYHPFVPKPRKNCSDGDCVGDSRV